MGIVVQQTRFQPVKVDVGLPGTAADVVTIVECTIPCKGEAAVVLQDAEYRFSSLNTAWTAARNSRTPTWGKKLYDFCV